MGSEMRNRMIRDGVLTASEAEGSSLQGAAIDAQWEESSDDRPVEGGNRPGTPNNASACDAPATGL